MTGADRLEVERLGGLAGLGGTRSRLRSRGELRGDQLSLAERELISRLFAAPAPAPDPGADGFRYRVQWHRPGVSPPLVMDLPGSALPAALLNCIKDEWI